MNARDFCFWLHGYTELTGGATVPPFAWNLILEHLALADNSDEHSSANFEGVVQTLVGYTKIVGSEPPSPDQWKRIVDGLTDCFNKVTSELDEGEEVEPEEEGDWEKKVQEIIDEINKTRPQPPPYPPWPPVEPFNPWKVPDDNLPKFPGPGDLLGPTICNDVACEIKCDVWPHFPDDEKATQAEIQANLKTACDMVEELHKKPSASDTVFCSSLDDAYDSHNPKDDV